MLLISELEKALYGKVSFHMEKEGEREPACREGRFEKWQAKK